MLRYGIFFLALSIALPVAALRPVLLVPGMGGSILRSMDGKFDGISIKTVVESLPNLYAHGLWFKDSADDDYRRYMLVKYDKDGAASPVFSREPLLPPYALDPKSAAPGTTCLHNFEPGGLCGVEYPSDLPYLGAEVEHFFNHSTLNNYAQLVAFLKSYGYVAEQTLFGFSYDWRHSNRQLENLQRLDDTLAKIYYKNGEQKISIFSHSLGCMVVKLYTALYPDNARKYIGQWIAAGAPFQGVGGYLLSSLFSGYCLGDLVICGCTARALMVQIPTVFEIMPSAWFEFEHQALSVSADWKGGVQQFRGHEEIGNLLRKSYEGHTFSYQGKTVDWPMSDDAWRWSEETRKILAQAEAIDEIELYAIYGVGTKTPYGATYPVSGPHFSPQELLCAQHGCPENRCVYSTATCQPQWDFIDGDGVAPTISASTPYVNKQPRTLVLHPVFGVSHRELIDDQADIYAHFKLWLGLSATPQ